MAHPPRDGGRLEPHLAVGSTYTDLKFQVDARYFGVIDRTRLVTDGWIHYVVAGVNARLGGRTSLAGEVFYAPLDVVGRAGRGEESADLLNVRAALRFALRKP